MGGFEIQLPMPVPLSTLFSALGFWYTVIENDSALLMAYGPPVGYCSVVVSTSRWDRDQGCPLGPPKSVSISTHQKRRCVGVVGLAAPAAGWSLRPAEP